MDASVAGIDTGEVKFFNKKRSGVKVIYLMCLWLWMCRERLKDQPVETQVKYWKTIVDQYGNRVIIRVYDNLSENMELVFNFKNSLGII